MRNTCLERGACTILPAMRKSKFRTDNVPQGLADRIGETGHMPGIHSEDTTAVNMPQALVEICERQPETRIVPGLCSMLDAVKAKRKPILPVTVTLAAALPPAAQGRPARP